MVHSAAEPLGVLCQQDSGDLPSQYWKKLVEGVPRKPLAGRCCVSGTTLCGCPGDSCPWGSATCADHRALQEPGATEATCCRNLLRGAYWYQEDRLLPPPVPLQCLLLTMLNIVPSGRGEIFTRSSPIILKQALKYI